VTDRLELLEVLFRVQPGVPFRPRRFQQPFAFVQAQRLRVMLYSEPPR